MTRLRMAVIGAGHLGKIHTRLLQQVDDVELVAVTDPTDAARAAVAKQFGVPTFASHRQIIDSIDAAVLAAPTDCHAAVAAELIEAGKHLLVEKPLAATPADARRLANLAAARRVTLQVGHVERFNPAWIAASGVLEKAKFVEAVRASRFPGRCLDVGVVMDLMIHDLDLVLSLTTAPVLSVQASGLSVVTDHEDLAEARVTFECGLVAQFKASRISPTASRQMQSFGEFGFADIDFGGPAATIVQPSDAILDRSFDLAAVTDSPLGFADRLFSDWLSVQPLEISPRNAILDELHDFVISIRSGVAPTVSGSAGARAVELAGQILETIAGRVWNDDRSVIQRGPHATPRERIDVASRRIHRQRRAA